MAEAPPDDAALARARLTRKRAALTLVGLLAVALVGLSSWQIVPAVFGAWVKPLPPSPPGTAARTCAEGIDHAERDARWDGIDGARAACAQSPEGLDAWAALLRLRTAQTQLAGTPSEPAEEAVLRREVRSHLPADLR